MNFSKNMGRAFASLGIAALCFGYFASYIPYSMMTKMLTDGLFEGMNGVGFSGFEIQPAMVLGSFIAMYLFISVKGWWKYATHTKILGASVPRPQWFTFISGLCTASQIVTTTLAYTFRGINIVFAMLIMRGGVLVMAPLVDLIVKRRRRKIYWPSWVASLLALIALVVSVSEKLFSGKSLVGEADAATYALFAIDMGLYLFGYFFRLFIMSNKAKGDDADERKRYFTEEQMVANPVLLIALFVIGFMGRGGAPDAMAAQFWQGFVAFPFKGLFLLAFIAGVFSYGTGLFGSLIFLDKRENTFTVPANRVSSIMAGVIATYLLSTIYGQRPPSTYDLIGAALIVAAILFLMFRSVMDRKRKTSAAKAR